LWELEADEDYSITTIQAGLVINIILNTTSMDKLGMSYGAQAVAMAQDLGLFESSVHIMDRRRRNAYDYTAWSIYFWMK
jgi:hypothetical protein